VRLTCGDVDPQAHVPPVCKVLPAPAFYAVMKTSISFFSRLLVAVPIVAAVSGCASGMQARVAAPAEVAAAPAPAVLTRSLYSRDPSGGLTEGDMQKVLESPIDLQFPARVGVVPLAEPFDPKGNVSIATRSTASRDLARALVSSPHFSQVSDVSTDLPNGGGIEGLRVVAARYRLRYLLLYSERFEDATHLNGWAWLYPTVIGMFVAPGVTVKSQGLAQADLLDVRTGTVLFSVVQPMGVDDNELMIGAARSHRAAQGAASATAARALAKEVTAQTSALVTFAERSALASNRAQIRILPAPVEIDAASTAGTSPPQ
jgi:rhombotail lipoprotein